MEELDDLLNKPSVVGCLAVVAIALIIILIVI